MKTKKILFAVFALLCVMAVSVSLSSCSSSDDEGDVIYSKGITSMSSSSSSVLEEMSLITTTFNTSLGVSEDTFRNYPGGDEAVISKCNSAAATLDNYAFAGSYTYTVQRVSGKGTSTIFTWNSK